MKSYWISISLLGLLACGGGSSDTADIDNNKKLVVLSTITDRPFESVFHADYYFNRLYQPEALDRRGSKQPYYGQSRPDGENG